MCVYLSKLTLNTKNPAVLRFLADPYEMHRTIWRAFPDARDGGVGRTLFRVEPTASGRPVIVIVQSDRKPDWGPMLANGILADVRETLIDGQKLDALARSGSLLRFRLKANPTKKVVDNKRLKADGSPKPVRVGLFGEDKQLDWLEGKALRSGFRVVQCRVTAKENSESTKAGISGKMTHLAVTFDGIIEVTDPEAFKAALESGIGSAKGFGFGLLSVALVRQSANG